GSKVRLPCFTATNDDAIGSGAGIAPLSGCYLFRRLRYFLHQPNDRPASLGGELVFAAEDMQVVIGVDGEQRPDATVWRVQVVLEAVLLGELGLAQLRS